MAEVWRAEADERLAMVLHDWWWNEPLTGDEHITAEAAALHDMRSLVEHLYKHNYAIVFCSEACVAGWSGAERMNHNGGST